MNIQTEQNENHQALITVDIEADQIERKNNRLPKSSPATRGFQASDLVKPPTT
ncbi:MAG: hypothetical protein HC806_07615 [Anaerolineae bacterium]|nr:hypothetical protein [Anaerolineae bacterium]